MLGELKGPFPFAVVLIQDEGWITRDPDGPSPELTAQRGAEDTGCDGCSAFAVPAALGRGIAGRFMVLGT